jgi:folate-binding protein YgfZ
VTELSDQYEALLRSVGAVDTKRAVINASGPDSTSFLQGQLSQDVAARAAGESRWSLLLQPQGKMDALLRVTRRGAEDWLLDLDAAWGDHALTRLQRFKLRTKCELALEEWNAIVVRGPHSDTIEAGGALISAPVDWNGLTGVDLVGPTVTLETPVAHCSTEALLAVRIEAGIAAMGHEIDEGTIPAEANVVEEAVSFTKGCFTGQELVARIDSRGSNTPRRLRGVLFAADAAIDEVREHVTSIAFSPGYDAPIALAYLGRGVDPGATTNFGNTGGTVRGLPMFAGEV